MMSQNTRNYKKNNAFLLHFYADHGNAKLQCGKNLKEEGNV